MTLPPNSDIPWLKTLSRSVSTTSRDGFLILRLLSKPARDGLIIGIQNGLEPAGIKAYPQPLRTRHFTADDVIRLELTLSPQSHDCVQALVKHHTSDITNLVDHACRMRIPAHLHQLDRPLIAVGDKRDSEFEFLAQDSACLADSTDETLVD